MEPNILFFSHRHNLIKHTKKQRNENSNHSLLFGAKSLSMTVNESILSVRIS